MDGVHDMGGMHGFGPIPIDAHGRTFSHPWEARAFACNLALGAMVGNVDRFRFLIESMPPAEYLAASYYERWLAATLALAEEQGFLSVGQLQAIREGQVPRTQPAQVDAVPPAVVELMANAPSPGQRDYSGHPRFAVGDRVRAVQRHIPGHTRLPRYVRGHIGVIARDNGNQAFPDTHAATGQVEQQRLYTVSFRATELWGAEANVRDSVRVDLWESYLDEP